MVNISDVWSIEQEILDVFHQFCIKENIKYSLGYGTLLGAIRHNGFIPWDDDIDVILLRADYDKFIEKWKEHPITGYVLQDEYDKKDDYPNNFCKLRKDHTTFIQSEDEIIKNYHKGIFIDIFPMDRLAPAGIKRKKQLFCFALNMLYSREYTDGSVGFIGFFQKLLLFLPRTMHTYLKKKAHFYMTKWNNTNNQLVVPCTMAFCKQYYPENLFDTLMLHDFNSKQYFITSNYDGFLNTMYGDYMQLPPESERVWKHNPIVISLSSNYEELE